MCDVDCGSETVGMVKKVLSWRSSSPSDANTLWDSLQASNTNLAALLTNGETEKFEDAFNGIRSKIREMSEKSGVPIEPSEQSELLDAVTKEVQGVSGGVVPGAGGYDAIVLLVRDDEGTKRELEGWLEKWSLEKGSKVKLLKAKGELEGARLE
jgi:phosphomevalonate kinase